MSAALMLASKSTEVTVSGPLVVASFDLFGITWNLTESIIVQWLVIAVVFVIILVLTSSLKVIPDTKRQAAAEWIVEFFTGTVKETMGEKYGAYIPYIGALFCFSLFSSLMGLLGLRSPTADLMVTGTWGIITFVMIQYNRAKTGGVKGYFHNFIEPLPFMLPFNIIGEIANPVSIALRHFGNIVAGMVISTLIYFALGNFAILIPAVLSLYFDIFSSVIQAYIFVMLTMCYVASAECE